jgi:RNA:NAD 2'-phosphotransferase (TPT1/KptA family)
MSGVINELSESESDSEILTQSKLKCEEKVDELRDIINIISKAIVQKLRHEKKIIMEKDGFVDIDNLKTFLSEFVKSNFTIENIKKSYLKQTDKKRWELKEECDKYYVRAFQGHSKSIGENITDVEEFQELISVPFTVYHGTTNKCVNIILEKGLKPMLRQHVHMASDLFGIRQNSEVILQIDMENAMKNGIKFYKASNGVILSKDIPCEFIKKLNDCEIETLKKYIKFVENDDPAIIDQFLLDLENTDSVLKTIIEQNSKLKKKCYKNALYNCYLIFVNGENDNILMSLGKKYDFPRGLPIFYIPGKQLNIYGFYPKFENDARNQNKLNESEFEGDELNFNFKYSGFLGQIIAFEIEGKPYWTTCSKKATNTDFSKDLYRIIKDKMNSAFVEKLCNEKIHFCGETMSKNDQMHGSRIETEALIVTSVGKGKWYDLTLCAEIDKLVEEDSYFVDFYPNEKMQEFAKENGLSVDNIYKISRDDIKSFMETLEKSRNFIDVEKMMEIIRETIGVEIKEGNITHQEICGNILEGLIIKIRSTGTKTIKYKFPFYTSRTMLLRSYIKDNIKDKITKACTELKSDFLDNCISYINSWVVNIKDDQNKWAYILLHLYKNFEEYTKEYDISNVSQHIFVMDKLIDDYNARKIEYIGDNPIITKKTSIIIPIVLSLGPIGVGKSTVSNALTELMNSSDEPQKFVHIDGDILDLDMATVLKLGEERNPYTLWQIYKNLINNYIPVLSTGGGCLFVYGKETKFILFDYIEKIFKGYKIEYNITIILPDKETKIITHENRNTIYEYLNNSTYNISDLFHEHKTKLGKIIDERNERSKNSGKVDDIINENSKTKMLNIDNLNIVKGVIDSCLSRVKENKGSKLNFLFFNKDYSHEQLENQKNYEIFKTVLNEINTPNINIPATFKQRRILCKYTKPDGIEEIHHITLDYDHDILVKSEIDEQYENKIVTGKYLMFFNKNYLDKKELLIENENVEITNSINEMNKICTDNYSLYSNLNRINDIKNIVSKIGKGKHVLLPILKEMNSILGKKPANQVFEIVKISENDIKEDEKIYHITVNSGLFPPSDSNILLENIKDKNRELEITLKKDKNIETTFYYDNIEHDVDVKFLNVFYIPTF